MTQDNGSHALNSVNSKNPGFVNYCKPRLALSPSLPGRLKDGDRVRIEIVGASSSHLERHGLGDSASLADEHRQEKKDEHESGDV